MHAVCRAIKSKERPIVLSDVKRLVKTMDEGNLSHLGLSEKDALELMGGTAKGITQTELVELSRAAAEKCSTRAIFSEDASSHLVPLDLGALSRCWREPRDLSQTI